MQRRDLCVQKRRVSPHFLAATALPLPQGRGAARCARLESRMAEPVV
jgi:hypothetical protein